MPFRAQIKEYARQRMSAQFGNLLLAIILALAPVFMLSSFSGFFNNFVLTLLTSGDSFSLATPILVFAMICNIFVLLIITTLCYPFVEVGLYGTALSVSRNEKISAITPYLIGIKGYLRKLGGMLWMYLFVFLWALLFYIPGFVKLYSYRFTPYILAEYPNVKARDALKISMRMTKGIKGELFVFDLSFIGWYLLYVCTCGLVGIYFLPYYYTASAALYESMKNNALVTGRITQDELNPIA